MYGRWTAAGIRPLTEPKAAAVGAPEEAVNDLGSILRSLTIAALEPLCPDNV